MKTKRMMAMAMAACLLASAGCGNSEQAQSGGQRCGREYRCRYFLKLWRQVKTAPRKIHRIISMKILRKSTGNGHWEARPRMVCRRWRMLSMRLPWKRLTSM